MHRRGLLKGEKEMIEYVVIGDTENYKNCLVALLGACTKEEADNKLSQMICNPDDHDKQLMEGHHNFRVVEVPEKEQWWHDPVYMAD